tara:strand:+ start:169 stop:489 length:321 start_codon:yes stop_codon:yes gene_type:complete
MKSFENFSENAAVRAVFKSPISKKVAAKVGGAVLAAKAGEELLKKLFGTKDNPPSGMRDVYNKDVTSNSDFDGTLNPSGDQKTKPTLKQLQKGVEQRKKETNKEKK